MRCRYCGAPTRVLATRETAEGFLLRRNRVCEADPKHRFATYEVDDSMYRTVIKHAARPSRVAGLVRKADRVARNANIIAQLKAGEKHAAVAQQFNLSDNMVSTIARRAGLPPARVVRRNLKQP